MASEESLNKSMEAAVRRYSSLFRLPSARKILLLLLLFCVGGSLASLVIIGGGAILSPIERLSDGLFLGLSVFLTSFAADSIISQLVMVKDPVFNFRRTMALSVFCWAVWLFFMLLGAAVGALTSNLSWWVKLCLLGFSATVILRLIVFNAVSMRAPKRLFTASLLQPFLNIVPFLFLWSKIGNVSSINITNIVAFLLSSVIVGFAATFSFIFLLNQTGNKTIGMQSVPLFKAFMLNWISGLNAPFEDLLEKLGEEQEVEVSVIRFGFPSAKAIMVVPSIHPGPFKNIGSSLLPAMLKSDLEREFGCIACVPHGMLGHEFDLASQTQSKKVISDVVSSLRSLEADDSTASSFVTSNNGLATACCQVFGKSALISFTLAPKTIEDLPHEFGQFVREEAKKRGLGLCTVVNAHNSKDGVAETQQSLAPLKDVAAKCLDKVLSQTKSSFQVGAASVLPEEFSLEDGMGSGGITVLIVENERQKAAYVVIDGNNMISGLRERILSSLFSIGIDEGEIFTTDTHAVSALIKSEQGYHPVGEAMENEKLIGYIKDATVYALAKLQPVEVSSRSIIVSHVKVIGARKLEALCLLIDQASQRAKRSLVPILAMSGLVLMLLSMFV